VQHGSCGGAGPQLNRGFPVAGPEFGDAPPGETPTAEVDSLLDACAAGSEGAFERLFALLYPDLRRLAHRHLRSQRGHHTLNTTALVHEAYLKLASWSGDGWERRAHFLAFTSRAMRHILVDHARRRAARKRGSGRIDVTLQTGLAVGGEERTLDLLALDEALDRLAERDPRLARVVECRFFAGLSADETAGALQTSLRTVERDWTRARTYLYHLLRPPPADA
jgi:RNA polymerase sigma factor (TIGR02999 family)